MLCYSEPIHIGIGIQKGLEVDFMTFLEQLTNVGIIARLNVDHTENCLTTCQHLFAGGLRGICLTAPLLITLLPLGSPYCRSP